MDERCSTTTIVQYTIIVLRRTTARLRVPQNLKRNLHALTRSHLTRAPHAVSTVMPAITVRQIRWYPHRASPADFHSRRAPVALERAFPSLHDVPRRRTHLQLKSLTHARARTTDDERVERLAHASNGRVAAVERERARGEDDDGVPGEHLGTVADSEVFVSQTVARGDESIVVDVGRARAGRERGRERRQDDAATRNVIINGASRARRDARTATRSARWSSVARRSRGDARGRRRRRRRRRHARASREMSAGRTRRHCVARPSWPPPRTPRSRVARAND